jgi:hypothetical protein
MVVGKGFDCATPLTAAITAAFVADGFGFVARYLVPSGWKRLTKHEANVISEAGLQIVSVFETTADRALGGRVAGLADGATALRLAQEIGQPAGSAIYFAVDFPATSSQMPAVIDYIRACSEATPGYNTGAYGSAYVVKSLRSADACSRFWQTYAWSHGEVVLGINIHQYDNGPNGTGMSMHGIGVDLNEFFGNEGWWNTLEPVEPVEEDELEMDIKYATVLIGLAKAAWREGVTKIELEDGTMQDVQEQDIREAANAARRASGQPEE